MPIRGLGMLVAPLAFLYRDRAQLYAVFQALYSRYFVHLHTLNSNANVCPLLSLDIIFVSAPLELFLQRVGLILSSCHGTGHPAIVHGV